ncbi:MAG TPA: hypothetical protein VNL92_05390, partial [Dehalococcoidia bacterium]|nr:hypothetical protein [Dehalococcoidia bacterium]
IPPLSRETQEALLEFTPFAGTSVRNPIDTAVFGDPELVRRTLELVAKDPAIDLILYPTGFGGMPGSATLDPEEQAERALAPARAVEREIGKPVVYVIRPPMTQDGLEATQVFQERAAEEGFAVFPSVARAARAIAALFERQRLLMEE